jgi:hypothetical protein
MNSFADLARLPDGTSLRICTDIKINGTEKARALSVTGRKPVALDQAIAAAGLMSASEPLPRVSGQRWRSV